VICRSPSSNHISKEAGGAAAVTTDGQPRPHVLKGAFFGIILSYNGDCAMAIQSYCRPVNRRAQLAFPAKDAPLSYSSFAIVLYAMADYNAEALLALVTALQAQRVVLSPSVTPNEYAPLFFGFFR
jgi:hypothetical protein